MKAPVSTDRRSLTVRVHALLADRVQCGDWVLDCTAGNGHDTHFLAERVGDGGRVIALDLDPVALEVSQARLAAAGLASRVRWIQGCHGSLPGSLAAGGELEEGAGRLAAAVFNLGFRPGAPFAGPAAGPVTGPSTTLAALGAVWRALAPGGCLAVVVYRGHAGGRAESAALHRWVRALPPGTRAVRLVNPAADRRRAPVAWWLERPDLVGSQ